MQAFNSCTSTADSSEFLDHEKFILYAKIYGLDANLLAAERLMAKRTLSSNNTHSTLFEVFVELVPLKTVFSTTVSILQIILTIAVSATSCEYLFASLKHVKTWLRTTIKEERLVDLATLSIERDLSQKLSFDEVVSDFASRNNRRIILS